jgi:SepF-like predicted cell division protein (DUF552 family)
MLPRSKDLISTPHIELARRRGITDCEFRFEVKKMGILQNLSKALGLSKDMDVEEYMDTMELENVDLLHEAADFYVKPVALESEADAKVIQDELKQRNIILLNITPMMRNQAKLRTIVNDLKTFVVKLNGDIARIDNEKILLTPAKVKIVKRRG